MWSEGIFFSSVIVLPYNPEINPELKIIDPVLQVRSSAAPQHWRSLLGPSAPAVA